MVREVLNGQTLGGASLRSHEGRVVCSWGPRGETAWWADGRPALEQDFDGEEEMERRIVELRAELGRLQQARYARERESYEKGISSKPTIGGVAHGSPLQCKSIDRNISMYSWDPINNSTPDDEHYALTIPDAPDPVKDPRLRKHWSNRSEKLADEIDFLFQQLTKEREINARGDSLMEGLPKCSPTYEKQRVLESEGWQFSEELEEEFEVFGRLVASDRRMNVDELDDRGYDLVMEAAREDIADLFDFNIKNVAIDKLQTAPFAICFSLRSRNIDAIPLAESCRHLLKQAHTQPNYHILKIRRTSETFFDETRRRDDETWYSSTVDAGESSIGNPRPASFNRLEGYSKAKAVEPPHKVGALPPAGSFTAVKSPPSRSAVSPHGSIVADGTFKSPPKGTRNMSKTPPSPQSVRIGTIVDPVVSTIDMKDFKNPDPTFDDFNFPTPSSMRSSPLGRSSSSKKKRSSSSKKSSSSRNNNSPVNDFVSPPGGFSTRMPSTKVPVPPESPRMTKSPMKKSKSRSNSKNRPPSTSYYRSGSKPPAPFTKVPAGSHLVE
eukprot:TRINITY_DN11737_c0_g1_i1.p1 TRINITY_DN11737_c0_g1~~TRINITY_DN11737_c0_g1_i1.p1  ORF type:complete len:595 (+),score=109.65 TRINITY_DN11737_c0_g1_i1:127-1785(+)